MATARIRCKRYNRGGRRRCCDSVAADRKAPAEWEMRIEAERRHLAESIEAERKQRERDMKAWEIKRETEREESMAKYRELDALISRVGATHGDYVEATIVNLSPKMLEYGLVFDGECRDFIYKNDRNEWVAQADRRLEGDDAVMVVEVKARVKEEDVKGHFKRLADIRKHMRAKRDERKLLGAMAGGIVPEQVIRFAQNSGMFVFVKNGTDISVAKPPEGFVPREW